MGSVLNKGSNGPLAGSVVTIGTEYRGAPYTPDIIALSLYDTGKVRGDDDMVYFNQPSSADGAIRLTGDALDVSVEVNLNRVGPEVQKILIVGNLESGTWGQVTGAVTTVAIDGQAAYDMPADGLSNEVTATLAELYRRGGGWKIRNVAQGYDQGLAALATHYGLTVDNQPASPEPAPSATAAPAAASSAIDLRKQEWLKEPPAGAPVVDLRKHKVAVRLEKEGILGVVARVAIVLDSSGSMSGLYGNGTVQRVLERLVPVACRLDDNAVLEVFAFATRAGRLPDVTERTMVGYLEQRSVKKALGKLGYDNVEPLVIKDILQKYLVEEPSSLPTLILFLSDGGIGIGGFGFFGRSTNDQIKDLIREASDKPVFWQFMGLGTGAGYGALEELDNLSGRVVDNADFFALDDIDRQSDDYLYEKLLTAFAKWVKEAQVAGILRP